MEVYSFITDIEIILKTGSIYPTDQQISSSHQIRAISSVGRAAHLH